MEIKPRNYEVAITTFDNPYDPFEQFEEWLMFDVEKGYNTPGHLDRITTIRDDMSQREIEEEIERGIDRMIELDFMNIYKKVTKEKENVLDDDESDDLEDE